MKKLWLFTLIALISPLMALAENSALSLGGASLQNGPDWADISWQNPESEDFANASLFQSEILIEDYFSYEAVEAFCDLIYQGPEENFRASGLAENLPYYFILFVNDNEGQHSKALVLKKEIFSAEAEKPQTEDGTKSLIGASSETVNSVSFSEAGIIYNYNKKINPKDSESERLTLFITVKSPHDLSERDKNAIAYFVDSGTPTTILLGAGERTGVLNSYLSAFDKLPRSILEWQDVIKIANGRWPDERNPELEKEAADTAFANIYERRPDPNNPNDSAAITVIAYGLRPAGRNLESEAKATEIYRNIFKKDPVEAFEWDLVRAIAYSGATR